MKTYKVKLDGKELDLNKIKVSKMPFNKVFRGEQRNENQTEDAYFVTMDITKPAKLEIEAEEDFKDYEIRPLEYNLSDKRYGNKVELTVDKNMQFTFEADGFHNALHVFVNEPSQKPKITDNVIYYGKGVHTVGLIWLESGQSLYLEEGAVVYGTIFAKDAEDIKISGRGILDSSHYRRGDDISEDGHEIRDALSKRGLIENAKDAGYKCTSIVMYNCKNVSIEGITIKDSMFWSVIIRNHCENVVLDNIKIIGQWRYNSDGIDICASKNVTVKNSFIRSFDDCVVARGAYLKDEYGNVENVVVKNNVIWCDWGKSLEIWCGNKPCQIRNIIFADNYLIRISSTAINVTTWFGSELALVENVVYKNIYINTDKSEYRMSPMIENDINTEYSSRGDVAVTVHIGPEKMGRKTGNQDMAEMDSYDEFSNIYRNILFENIHTDDKLPIVTISEDNAYTEIYGISAKNCEFEIKR